MTDDILFFLVKVLKYYWSNLIYDIESSMVLYTAVLIYSFLSVAWWSIKLKK